MNPKKGTGVPLHNLNSIVKQLELQDYGVRTAANVNVQAECEEPYRTAE